MLGFCFFLGSGAWLRIAVAGLFIVEPVVNEPLQELVKTCRIMVPTRIKFVRFAGSSDWKRMIIYEYVQAVCVSVSKFMAYGHCQI